LFDGFAGQILQMSEPMKNSSDPISTRERQMLLMLRLGKTNLEIADELGISGNTVKTHLRSLFKKIGVSNRTQASHWEG
jgi:DNA-binding CsgD family transcriptional regulator